MASDGEGRAGGPAPAKQQHTVEYCSSDTPAKCKRCKQLIARGHLTYGCQEEGQGGRADLYHWECLNSTLLASIGGVGNLLQLDELTPEDVDCVTASFLAGPLGTLGIGSPAAAKQQQQEGEAEEEGVEAAVPAAPADPTDLFVPQRNAEDVYIVEYDPSGRASCTRCKLRIPRGSLRFGVSFEMKYSWCAGTMTSRYRHIHCLTDQVIGNSGCVANLKGFADIKAEDQQLIRDKYRDPSACKLPCIPHKKIDAAKVAAKEAALSRGRSYEEAVAAAAVVEQEMLAPLMKAGGGKAPKRKAAGAKRGGGKKAAAERDSDAEEEVVVEAAAPKRKAKARGPSRHSKAQQAQVEGEDDEVVEAAVSKPKARGRSRPGKTQQAQVEGEDDEVVEAAMSKPKARGRSRRGKAQQAQEEAEDEGAEAAAAPAKAAYLGLDPASFQVVLPAAAAGNATALAQLALLGQLGALGSGEAAAPAAAPAPEAPAMSGGEAAEEEGMEEALPTRGRGRRRGKGRATRAAARGRRKPAVESSTAEESEEEAVSSGGSDDEWRPGHRTPAKSKKRRARAHA